MAVNVQAAVEAQVFGANVTGMVSKTTDTEGKTVLEFLVMPSALTENNDFTVDEVVKEINDTIYRITHNTSDPMPDDQDPYIKAEDIDKALSFVGLEEPSMDFTQTFIHYKKIGTADGTVEYALGIHIKSKVTKNDDFKFLEIKEIYINVWDTQNQKILEKMQIWTPQQLEALE